LTLDSSDQQREIFFLFPFIFCRSVNPVKLPAELSRTPTDKK
jgi:hypothetical protein